MLDFSAYAIESDGAGAGIVIRQQGGFRFYASDERFTSLDGKMFRSPQEAERAAQRLIARPRRMVRGGR